MLLERDRNFKCFKEYKKKKKKKKYIVPKKGSLVYVSKECTMIIRTHILKSKTFQAQYVFLESLEAVNTWR